MAAKQKYYVVWEGRQPGVYDNWEDCHEQIDGYPRAKFMSFKSQAEAIMAFRGDGREEENLLSLIALKNTEHAAAAQSSTPSILSNEPSNTPSIAPSNGLSTASSAAPSTGFSNTPSIASSNEPIARSCSVQERSSCQPIANPQPQRSPQQPLYAQIPEINPAAIAVDGACAGNPGLMEYRGVKVATGEEIFHVGPLADGTNNVAEYLALVHALALLFRQNDSTTPIYTDSKTAVAWVRNRGCRTQLVPNERNRKIFEMLARANLWIRSHRFNNPILRWNTPLWGEIPADFGRK